MDLNFGSALPNPNRPTTLIFQNSKGEPIGEPQKLKIVGEGSPIWMAVAPIAITVGVVNSLSVSRKDMERDLEIASWDKGEDGYVLTIRQRKSSPVS